MDSCARGRRLSLEVSFCYYSSFLLIVGDVSRDLGKQQNGVSTFAGAN